MTVATVYIEIVERDIRTMHEWLTATVYIEIVEGCIRTMHEWLTAYTVVTETEQ